MIAAVKILKKNGIGGLRMLAGQAHEGGVHMLNGC